MKIKRKINNAAPAFPFQLRSCRVDNKIQKLDSKKSCQKK